MPGADEKKIESFLKKYSPEIATELRAGRKRLHKLFPRGYELIYDNYNALVFAFSASERATDLVLSIAGYPKWVTLFFANGATLSDPYKLLQGSGSRIRGVRLTSADDLDDPQVLALIKQAQSMKAAELRAAKPLQTVVRSISAKQRPRRAPAAKKRKVATQKVTKRRK
jgi:Domain of unknown function (DU1801)